MNADAFRHFYNYHFAENRKIWDSYITSLTQEQFTQNQNYSYGSVRNQIVHLMSVDEAWFSGLRGGETPECRIPLTLTIGKSFEPVGIPLSRICALTWRICGTICCSKNRSPREKTKTLSCGRCCSMWPTMGPIIAPSFSDC